MKNQVDKERSVSIVAPNSLREILKTIVKVKPDDIKPDWLQWGANLSCKKGSEKTAALSGL